MADEVIGGINPVLEALRARGRAFQHIYMARGRSGPAAAEIRNLARAHGIRIERVERSRLDRLFGGSGHQGVAARVGPFLYSSLEDILRQTRGPRALVLFLDGVQDPMNLGALLRSAEAAGALGVIMPRDRSAPVSAAALKASAGAAEHVPVARAINLVRALDDFKEAGFWIIGAHPGVETSIFDLDLDLRLGLVVGGEGRGLRRLVRERCDRLASIPLRGRTSSLNVAAAGAIAMFEYVRQTRGQ